MHAAAGKKERRMATNGAQLQPETTIPPDASSNCGEVQVSKDCTESELPTKRTSPLRAEAARRNGSLSRGPITSEGKNVSRLNALKHGLRAETLLLEIATEEEKAAFQNLRERLEGQFPAHTIEEQLLLENMVHALWQKRRTLQFEARELREDLVFHGPVMDRILRYATSADKRLFRALAELKRLQKENPSESADQLADTAEGEV
jgi:hypothetical protein